MGAAAEPLVVTLPDGREIAIRGRIDRVDRAVDGTVVVADYKTGSSSRYGDLSPDAPLADGTKLQLPIYGLAIRAVHPDATGVRTEYWFVSTKGEWKRIGYDVTDDVVELLHRTLTVVADGVTSGLFPMRPPAPVWRAWIQCEYCDPDGLGTADHHRAWERIRTHPALRGYVALVEPDALTATVADDAEGAMSHDIEGPAATATQEALW